MTLSINPQVGYTYLMKNILIVTPLSLELEVLKQNLAQLGWDHDLQQRGALPVHHFHDQHLYMALSGHGKVQSAIQTQYLIDRIPNLTGVLCMGASGSLSAQLKAGDIVYGYKTVEHDYTLRFIQKPLPEFLAHDSLLSAAEKISSRPYGIHKGVIASGDEDIVSSLRADEVAKKTGAIAVGWEGAGVARACAFSRIPFMEVRTVTDASDKNAVDDFRHNLRIGVANLADFTAQFMGNY